MATIFFAWELGAGLGHIMELAPLVNAMAAQGHRVYAAMRDLAECREAFDERAVLLPAPYLAQSRAPRRNTRTFADLLAGLTFCDDRTLVAHADAWRGLYDLIRPDAIVFDYSPTALLAARAAAPDAKRIVIGNGFLIPPDVSPFPSLRPWLKQDPTDAEDVRALEQRLLDRANNLLRGWKPRAGAELDRLGQLFGQADLTLMMTLREMDPYAAHRPAGTVYLGAVNATGGREPEWPDTGDKKRPRVYAYLRPVPVMPDVLRFLGERKAPAVVFAPALTEAGRKRFAAYKTLRFETERLDLQRVGAECDLAILNGNLGTSSAMLVAGKPALHLPENLEHLLNARGVARLGAGLVGSDKEAGTSLGKLAMLLDGDGAAHAAGAQKVAARYASFTPARQAEAMTEALARVVRPRAA